MKSFGVDGASRFQGKRRSEKHCHVLSTRRISPSLPPPLLTRVLVLSIAFLLAGTRHDSASAFTSNVGLLTKSRSFLPTATTRRRTRSSIDDDDDAVTNTAPSTGAAASVEAPTSYLRWNNNNDDPEATDGDSTFELQTAVTTFQRGQNNNTQQHQIVELHAQLHLGDADYFQFYNTPEFNDDKTAVLYELLLDEDLLENVDFIHHPNKPRRRRLKVTTASSTNIQASNNDQALALQYGWTCQANIMNYGQKGWYHADLTRQEFLNILKQQQGSAAAASTQNSNVPLWELAYRQQQQQSIAHLPGPALEAATALLVGPPIFLQQQRQQRRRLFTNLFLPGDSLAVWLRFILWVTVPSPELSILLLDWSSSWFLPSASKANKTTKEDKEEDSRTNNTTTTSSRFSRIVIPVLLALAAGRIDQVRQLIFGQVVLSGHNNIALTSVTNDADIGSVASSSSLLITQRNDRALELLQDQLSLYMNKVQQQERVALLYGCNHCPDLHAKLVKSGFVPVKTEWRTAWSVALQATSNTSDNVPQQAASNDSSSSSSSSPLSFGLFSVFLLLPIYFVIGGADWIATWQDVAKAADHGDFLAVATDSLFYLFRHVLLYVGLSKLVLDFGGESNSSVDVNAVD